jgi:hypothetical protein
MTKETLENIFRDAIKAVSPSTPGRYALFVSPELYVLWDSFMQKASGGTVARPLMFGSYTIVEDMDARMGTAILERRSEIKRIIRTR